MEVDTSVLAAINAAFTASGAVIMKLAQVVANKRKQDSKERRAEAAFIIESLEKRVEKLEQEVESERRQRHECEERFVKLQIEFGILRGEFAALIARFDDRHKI